MILEFDEQKMFMQSIDVVDIGNTALRCSDGINAFYIVIRTVLGKTSILTFGPVVEDIAILQDNFSCAYQKIDYKEKIIIKAINGIIKNSKLGITSVEEILIETAIENLPDISILFMNDQ